MYNELEIIDKIENKADRVKLLITFLQEYSGWLQHLSSIGMVWGAGGEEVGANKERLQVLSHLERIKSRLTVDVLPP